MPESHKRKRTVFRIVFVCSLVVSIIAGAFFGYFFKGSIEGEGTTETTIREKLMERDSCISSDSLPPGCWKPVRDVSDEKPLTPEQQAEIDQIRSLGYLSGYEEASYLSGVTIHDDRACPGYNILISGHGPGVMLIDMDGNEIHEWYTPDVSLYGLWPDAQNPNIRVDFWRRTHLEENGNLIVMVEGGGVVKVDMDSNLLWASEYNGAHHDISVSDVTGNIYVIGRNIHINPDFNPERLLVEDYICVLDSLGNEIETISLIDALEHSPYAPVFRKMPHAGDVLHTNTIEIVEEGDLPEDYDGLLRDNSLILSMRTINMVCFLDLHTNEIYWAESDLWKMQHQPTLLENGNILIFDNQGWGEMSTILEFSPETREIIWQYQGSEDEPFYSAGSGSCQRLPNDNTLITESHPGRAFEVTPEGEIVWEYYNPYRAGENNELIATLFEVVRIPASFPIDRFNSKPE